MNYTCQDYRQENRLLALRRQMEDPNISKALKEKIKQEIEELEKAMGLD